MSRYDDYDDYEGEPEQILAQGRWERNARAVLKSKRGRRALAELREALMALPEHRLIEGAVCTVGAARRRAAKVAEAQAEHEEHLRFLAENPVSARFHGPDRGPDLERAKELDQHVGRDGEGVCAVGAYAWYRKVKGGADPAEAFASLPDFADEGSDALSETADLGQDAGMTYTLAWELAYRNDETFARKTPEERHAAFVAWIDQQLAGTEAA